MKKLVVILIVIAAALGTKVQAQAPKFGHIDMNQLVQVMPERQAALKDLQTYATDLETQITNMQKELETKYTAYISKRDSMSELIRQANEADIQDKQQRLENFKTVADQDYQKKQNDLMKPIIEKADKSITDVAKELNLVYVFDISTRVVIYKSNESVDLLPLVKKKLGIL